MSRNSLPDEEYETVSEESVYRGSYRDYCDDEYYDDDRTDYYEYGTSSDRLYAGAETDEIDDEDAQDEDGDDENEDDEREDASPKGQQFQIPNKAKLRDYLDQAKYFEDNDVDEELEFKQGELTQMMQEKSQGDDSSFNDDGIPPSEDEHLSSDFVESDVGDYVPPLTRTKYALVFSLEKYQAHDEDDDDEIERKREQRMKALADFKNFMLKKRAAKAYRRYLKVRGMEMDSPDQEAFMLEKMEIVDKKLHRPYYYEESEPPTYKKLLQKRRRTIKRKYELYALDPEYRKELQYKILTDVGKYLAEPEPPVEQFNETFDPDAAGSLNRTMDTSPQNQTFQGLSTNQTFQGSPTNRTIGLANQTFQGSLKNRTGSPLNRTYGSQQAQNRTFSSPQSQNKTFGSTRSENKSMNKTLDGTFDKSARGDTKSLGNVSVFQDVSEINSSEEECMSASDGSSFYDDIVLPSELDFFSSEYEEDCNVFYPGGKSRTCERYKRYLTKCQSVFFDTEQERIQKKFRAAEVSAQFQNYLEKRRALKALSRMKVVEKMNFKHPVQEAEQLLHLEIVDKKLHKAYYYAPDEPDTYKVLLGKRRRALIRKYEKYATSENFRDNIKTDIYAKVLRIRPSPIFDTSDSEYDSKSSFNDSEIPSSEENHMSEGEIELPHTYEKPITRRRRQLYQELEQYEPDGLHDTESTIMEKRKRRLELIQRFKDSLAERRHQKALQRLRDINQMGTVDNYFNANILRDREIVDKKLDRGFYYSPGEPEEFKQLLQKRIRAIERKFRKYATDHLFREQLKEKYESAKPKKIEPDIEEDLAWLNQTLPQRDKYGPYDQTVGEDYSLPLFDKKVARRRDYGQEGIWPPRRDSAPAHLRAVWPSPRLSDSATLPSSYDEPRQYYGNLLRFK